MSVTDKPVLERSLAMRRMFPGTTDALETLGWSSPEGVQPCASCGAGTTWRDPKGVLRHPWCVT